MDIKEQVARRRAEMDGERAQTASAASAAAALERAETRATAELDWAQRARLEKARLDEEHPSPSGRSARVRKAGMDRLLREAVRARWTPGERATVVAAVGIGILLLTLQPLFGALFLLGGWGVHTIIDTGHRNAVLKAHPDLFDDPKQPAR